MALKMHKGVVEKHWWGDSAVSLHSLFLLLYNLVQLVSVHCLIVVSLLLFLEHCYVIQLFWNYLVVVKNLLEMTLASTEPLSKLYQPCFVGLSYVCVCMYFQHTGCYLRMLEAILPVVLSQCVMLLYLGPSRNMKGHTHTTTWKANIDSLVWSIHNETFDI